MDGAFCFSVDQHCTLFRVRFRRAGRIEKVEGKLVASCWAEGKTRAVSVRCETLIKTLHET